MPRRRLPPTRRPPRRCGGGLHHPIGTRPVAAALHAARRAQRPTPASTATATPAGVDVETYTDGAGDDQRIAAPYIRARPPAGGRRRLRHPRRPQQLTSHLAVQPRSPHVRGHPGRRPRPQPRQSAHHDRAGRPMAPRTRPRLPALPPPRRPSTGPRLHQSPRLARHQRLKVLSPAAQDRSTHRGGNRDHGDRSNFGSGWPTRWPGRIRSSPASGTGGRCTLCCRRSLSTPWSPESNDQAPGW